MQKGGKSTSTCNDNKNTNPEFVYQNNINKVYITTFSIIYKVYTSCRRYSTKTGKYIIYFVKV